MSQTRQCLRTRLRMIVALGALVALACAGCDPERIADPAGAADGGLAPADVGKADSGSSPGNESCPAYDNGAIFTRTPPPCASKG